MMMIYSKLVPIPYDIYIYTGNKTLKIAHKRFRSYFESAVLEKAGRWARLLADHAPKLPYYMFYWKTGKLKEAVKNEFIMLRKREEARRREEERSGES